MVRSADGQRVNLLAHLVEHFAEVEIAFGLRKFLSLFVEPIFVDVANRDNLAELAGLEDVAVALAADADSSKAELGIRSVGRPNRRKSFCSKKVSECSRAPPRKPRRSMSRAIGENLRLT